jgi:hypothetical protein
MQPARGPQNLYADKKCRAGSRDAVQTASFVKCVFVTNMVKTKGGVLPCQKSIYGIATGGNVRFLR